MINIAIDGPSGVGKSSLAKSLAKELSFIYLDTGALYRAVGLFVLENDGDITDRKIIVKMLDKINIEVIYKNGVQSVLVNGNDVSGRIRTQEVAMAASKVSALPEVRKFLLNIQKDIAAKENVIMDGRDAGTVIIPNAEIKFFLTANPQERAKRRYTELLEKGQKADYNNVLNEIIKRDDNDSNREIAPLKPAEDAIIIDNSEFLPHQTLEIALEIVRSKINAL